MAKTDGYHSKTGPKIKFSAFLDHFIQKKYFLLGIKWSSLVDHLKTGRNFASQDCFIH
jgi:hypothetical protein